MVFNKFLFVFCDLGVMKFVKYLGVNVLGSRWDVLGEFEVGVFEEELVEDGVFEVEGFGEGKVDVWCVWKKFLL